MAGNHKTKEFNIGASTLMITNNPSEVEELKPETHSVGLTKGFSTTTETTEVTLTEGIANDEVDSQITGRNTTVSVEVYEYTASNIAWAAGLNGDDFITGISLPIKTDITGGASATTIILTAETDESAKFPVGTIVQVQNSTTGKYDSIYLAKVKTAVYESVAKTLTLTLEAPIPTSFSFKAGDKVFASNLIKMGTDAPQPYVGIKIVGILPNGNEPITIIYPKAKITGGSTLEFKTDGYSFMPYEFKPYKLGPSDALYEKHGAVSYIIVHK